MANTILPSGEEIYTTPEELLKYLNPDGIRQLLRQERLRWNLKPNTDLDYVDKTYQFKFSADLHNEGIYQRMEIRTFPDNGAYPGFAGINIDSGLFGLPHYLDAWDESMTEESVKTIINRVAIGALATVPTLSGYGRDDMGDMSDHTPNRIAAAVFDPFDGRAYLLSNDEPRYVNNETRRPRIPSRAIARMIDIPTRITDLVNDLDFVADPDYRHTDNNFTHSNRFVLDNLDDRTFVYPEIAKDSSGRYIENLHMGMNGQPAYDECDVEGVRNTQEDTTDDRAGAAPNSYNRNVSFSGVGHKAGYLPGIFKSLEELQRVDLVGQHQTPKNHQNTPGAKRPTTFYIHDGVWGKNWFDRLQYNDSYLATSMNPNNMEIAVEGTEPTPYSKMNPSSSPFDTAQLYQWRYNRVDVKFYAKDITISIVQAGEGYHVGDILQWSFGDDVFEYLVRQVGTNGQIQSGEYHPEKGRIYEQDPSTRGIGLPFANRSSTGHGAMLSIASKATIESHATQIKNNLYAYVDVTPTVRSDNSSVYSDTHTTDGQDGLVHVRSTAAGPAYSGINSGRGGPMGKTGQGAIFYEHGGNATAGLHVHLFRYVINTQNPTWVIKDGVQVFTGEWVDQGPMGVERPCDIKALLFSNPDTNNFNNYYKFMLDTLLDKMFRSPDAIQSNDPDAIAIPYVHIDQVDPVQSRRFYDWFVDPETNRLVKRDVTERVLYLNAATGMWFTYNAGYKNDPSFGYGMRAPGWGPAAGGITR